LPTYNFLPIEGLLRKLWGGSPAEGDRVPTKRVQTSYPPRRPRVGAIPDPRIRAARTAPGPWKGRRARGPVPGAARVADVTPRPRLPGPRLHHPRGGRPPRPELLL